MVFCSNCGQQMNENETFCVSCGTPVEPPPVQRTLPNMVNPANTNPFSSISNKKDRNKFWITVVEGVMLILILIDVIAGGVIGYEMEDEEGAFYGIVMGAVIGIIMYALVMVYTGIAKDVREIRNTVIKINQKDNQDK